METTEVYNLKWDEHYSKVVLESFWNLLGQEVLTDCTLVCNTPAESVQVHRLILSANSPYFRTLLKTHSAHPHPIIILHDVDLAVLKMLVTFMYRGEVNVSSATFPLLLKTAENLQIIGLSQSQQPSSRFSNTSVSNTSGPPTHYSKKARILENSYGESGGRKVSNSGGGGINLGGFNDNSGGGGGGGGWRDGVQEQPLSLRRIATPPLPPQIMNKKESISAPCTPLTSNNLDYYALRNHHHNSEENHDDSDEEVAFHKVVGKMRSVSGGVGGGGGGPPTNLTTHSHPHSNPHSHHNPTPHSSTHSSRPTSPPSPTPHPSTHHPSSTHSPHSSPSSSPPPSSPLICPYCPSSPTSPSPSPSQNSTPQNFLTTSLLTHHILTHHPNHTLSDNPTTGATPPGILCKFCSKPFPEVSSLIQHLPIHTGDRPFKCEFCGKAFKLRHHMKDHARVHTGERPFRCGLCGKTFSRSTILKAHEKTHFPKGQGE